MKDLALFLLPLIGFPIILSSPSCPAGAEYSSDLNACLAFDEDGLPYELAEQVCKRYPNGHLTSIHSVLENSIIMDLAKKHRINTNLLIGLSQKNGNWIWSDGTDTDYFKWSPGQPGVDLCVSIYSDDYTWKSIDCKNSIAFVCRIPVTGSTSSSMMTTSTKISSTITSILSSTLPISTTTQAIKNHTLCETNWIYLESTGMCYYHGKKRSFEAAEKYCLDHNGHLASVHSPDENEFIKQMTSVNYCGNYSASYLGATFLGGYLDTTANTLEWLDGSHDDFRGQICGNSDGPSMIMLGSFPSKCAPPCSNGDWWPLAGLSSNTTISDFVCKSKAAFFN